MIVRNRKRLGDMLVEAGMLTELQLEEALEGQRKASMKLGAFLIDQRMVNEHDLVNLLSEQLKIERYSVIDHPVDMHLSSKLPVEFVKSNMIVPVKQNNDELIVAVTDPTDFRALDTIEEMTDLHVTPIICTTIEFDQLVGGIYGLAELNNDDIGQNPDALYEVEDMSVSSLVGLAEGANVVQMVDWIMTQAVQEGASDVHFSPEKNYIQLRFRVDGHLHKFPPPPREMLLPIISRIKILSSMDIALSRVPQDGRFTVKIDGREINVRASTTPTIYGENLVLRLLDMNHKVRGLQELGVREQELKQIEEILAQPHGLILTTGPTGSGKTTSLYALLQKVCRPDINVMTIEDPVEYRMEGVRHLQLNHRAGMTFASGLRSILRQDPDVIMVGEIRDSETANTTVQSALTGHTVLSTLHTNTSAGAIARLMDMGIEPFLIASILQVVIAQRLIRTICPDCAEEYEPDDAVLESWGIKRTPDMIFRQGRGCHSCRDSGYKGRIGIYEVLVVDAEVRSLILKKASADDIIDNMRSRDVLRTLREDAVDKIISGQTTFIEAAGAVMIQ